MNFAPLSFGINQSTHLGYGQKLSLQPDFQKKKSACSQIFREKYIEWELGKLVSIVEKALKKSEKIAKFATAELAKLQHSLGETEMTKHWQKVRPKFGRTESSVDHY